MYINLGLCVPAWACAHVRSHIPTSLNMSRIQNGRIQDAKNEYVNQHVVDEQIKNEKLKAPYNTRFTSLLLLADKNVPGVHFAHFCLLENMLSYKDEHQF